jgi:DNA-directed RNA polymerase subunit RPC12/RpoP
VFASVCRFSRNLITYNEFLPYEVQYNMCFVDSSSADSVDLSAAAMTRYECSACGNRFKGMGSKLSCPTCQSTDLKKLD